MIETPDRCGRARRSRRRSLQLSKVVGSDGDLAPQRPTSLGLWVPGVVTTPIGALSSPATMAARIRAQNASSMRVFWRTSLSSLIPI